MKYLWGVDLGGTKIECIVIEAESGEILIRKRIDTEADKGYKHIISQIGLLINIVKEETAVVPTAIGFSTPGTLDPGLQTMKNCNTVCMNGQPMKKDLEELLKIRIEMANDANCFALAEATMGAAKDLNAEVVFGVIMGTGVGGGVVVNGKVIGGKHGIGGEWGHIVLDVDGEACYCGKSGCNEKVFAGPALERYYEGLSGQKLRLQEIYQRHLAHTDLHATATIDHLMTSFARAISSIINVLDPDVIVLGGGVSNIDLLYIEGVKQIENYIFNNRKVETVFLKPLLGDSAGVFGAAELVRN
jgi:predicted NBD/HSP70 family sugar kinase